MADTETFRVPKFNTFRLRFRRVFTRYEALRVMRLSILYFHSSVQFLTPISPQWNQPVARGLRIRDADCATGSAAAYCYLFLLPRLGLARKASDSWSRDQEGALRWRAEPMKFPINRETTSWTLKRHPWRGSLLVASGKVFAPRER